MSSSQEFVLYVCEQMKFAADVSYRRMFGEYGLFAEGKFFAVICDNQLFFKPTLPVQTRFSLCQQPPYPGAKPYLRMDDLDNPSLVSEITRLTLDSLPYLPSKKRTIKGG